MLEVWGVLTELHSLAPLVQSDRVQLYKLSEWKFIYGMLVYCIRAFTQPHWVSSGDRCTE